MINRIRDAAELIANAALEHPDVDAATPHPPDTLVHSHLFIADFAIDDFNPTWGDRVDCNFSIRWATQYSEPESAWEAAYRIIDRDAGVTPLIEALAGDTDSPFEEIIVRRAGAQVVLDQQSNTRYLAVDLTADAFIRSTP